MTSLLLAIIYIAFISLGLPDSLLGAGWPSMYPELGVPVSFAGLLSMVIALGTVVSSLLSDRLTRRFGTGRVTVCSVALTAAALLGFSVSRAFWMLLLWAVPYGLGAGSVDASLNNYVALHYKSRHMSWLHCMWGIGAAVGPSVMSLALTRGAGWAMGYRWIGLLQIGLTAVLFLSLPLWKGRGAAGSGAAASRSGAEAQALTLRETVRISGAKESMFCFFCYSAVEQTAALWAGSYLTLQRGVSAETAAGFAGLFFVGITAGRAANGFFTLRWSDDQMIRLGQVLLAAGILLLLLPGSPAFALAGFLMLGLGCAPIYPCIIHSTPARFGADRSQAMIGVQMASAYCGTTLMPPLFGLLAGRFSTALLPLFLLLFLLLMAIMHGRMLHQVR